MIPSRFKKMKMPTPSYVKVKPQSQRLSNLQGKTRPAFSYSLPKNKLGITKGVKIVGIPPKKAARIKAEIAKKGISKGTLARFFAKRRGKQ